jgi:hypothetical protein
MVASSGRFKEPGIGGLAVEVDIRFAIITDRPFNINKATDSVMHGKEIAEAYHCQKNCDLLESQDSPIYW